MNYDSIMDEKLFPQNDPMSGCCAMRINDQWLCTGCGEHAEEELDEEEGNELVDVSAYEDALSE